MNQPSIIIDTRSDEQVLADNAHKFAPAYARGEYQRTVRIETPLEADGEPSVEFVLDALLYEIREIVEKGEDTGRDAHQLAERLAAAWHGLAIEHHMPQQTRRLNESGRLRTDMTWDDVLCITTTALSIAVPVHKDAPLSEHDKQLALNMLQMAWHRAMRYWLLEFDEAL